MDLEQIISSKKPEQNEEKHVRFRKPVSEKQKMALAVSRNKRAEKQKVQQEILKKIQEIESTGYSLDEIHGRVMRD